MANTLDELPLAWSRISSKRVRPVRHIHCAITLDALLGNDLESLASDQPGWEAEGYAYSPRARLRHVAKQHGRPYLPCGKSFFQCTFTYWLEIPSVFRLESGSQVHVSCRVGHNITYQFNWGECGDGRRAFSPFRSDMRVALRDSKHGNVRWCI